MGFFMKPSDMYIAYMITFISHYPLLLPLPDPCLVLSPFVLKRQQSRLRNKAITCFSSCAGPRLILMEVHS